MNEFILKAMNPSKYSKEELKANAEAARTAYGYALYAAANTTAEYAAVRAAGRATHDEYAAEYAAGCAEYWFNKYFELTGENKQDYIDAINNDNDKSVYTQEMLDDGVLPSVGMQFVLSYHEKDSRFNEFNNKVVKVLSISECGVYTFYQETLGFGALMLSIESVKPIESITKLIDGQPYQFESRQNKKFYGIYNEDRDILSISQGQWFDVEAATNIKPLTVKRD